MCGLALSVDGERKQIQPGRLSPPSPLAGSANALFGGAFSGANHFAQGCLMLARGTLAIVVLGGELDPSVVGLRKLDADTTVFGHHPLAAPRQDESIPVNTSNAKRRGFIHQELRQADALIRPREYTHQQAGPGGDQTPLLPSTAKPLYLGRRLGNLSKSAAVG